MYVQAFHTFFCKKAHRLLAITLSPHAASQSSYAIDEIVEIWNPTQQRRPRIKKRALDFPRSVEILWNLIVYEIKI